MFGDHRSGFSEFTNTVSRVRGQNLKLDFEDSRNVRWQESGDTIRTTIQGEQYHILRYYSHADILSFFPPVSL